MRSSASALLSILLLVELLFCRFLASAGEAALRLCFLTLAISKGLKSFTRFFLHLELKVKRFDRLDFVPLFVDSLVVYFDQFFNRFLF